jgi:hypothetical protein
MTAIDASTVVVSVLLSVLATAALYIWTAIALSAVFRKSGEEAWKAWVPVLNIIVVLQLGGLSPWLVLLGLIPLPVLWVVIVIACHRINVAFGYGAGMTVLAALLFPVWATVVGFGSARWVGAEEAPGVRRSTVDAGDRAAAPSNATAPIAGAAAWTGASGSAARGESTASPAPASAGGWAPSTPGQPVPPLPPSAPAPSGAGATERPDEPISFVPVLSPSAPRTAAGAPPPEPDQPGTEKPEPGPTASAPSGWGGFELGAASELTSETTAAVAGAPHPISAVPGEPARGPRETDSTPSVTRVPAARPSSDEEPWAPSRSPLPEPDAFPEASGEVSAVAGAPDAGVPRSARSSVSAQHVLPEFPDDVGETVIANRRKTRWMLVLPSGSPVELHADVVLVGRRPAPSAAYPNAQLVEVDDGTVSKTHMRLERHGEEWSVTDLHSTNGTILIASDGAEREIAPGAAHRAPARLLLGDAELRLADDASR